MKIGNDKIKTDWDLAILGKSEEDPKFKKERERAEKFVDNFESKWRNNKNYLKSPAVLRRVLEEIEQFLKEGGVGEAEGYYLSLRNALNQDNKKIKAKINKLELWEADLSNRMNFFKLSLVKIPENRRRFFLNSRELKDYKYWLERVFADAGHQLTEQEEKIMNLKAGPAQRNWISMVNNLLAKETRRVLTEEGKQEEKTLTEIMSLMNSMKKRVRDKAAEAVNDILAKLADVAEAEINSILTNKQINDGLRNFDRPDATRHLRDDINSKTVDVMIEAVAANFKISQKYYRIKAKMLKVKRLGYHERNIPIKGADRKYNFTESLEEVVESFDKLDSDFGKIAREMVEKGRIDVYSKKGKIGGAFCAAGGLKQPIFVMLNHAGDLRDVTTLAHELGHAINDIYMQRKRNVFDFGTTLATAEVASTFFEDFVLEDIKKKLPEKKKKALTMEKLNDDVSTIFRQVACYKFEQELHWTFRERGYLSKEEIGSIFQKHMRSYMGGAVEQSPGSENWWIYWGHIRRFFYNYSYASGLLISKAMQRKVRENPEFIKKVKIFLEAGLSSSPEDIFKEMGIDITKRKFWEEGLKEIKENLKRLED